MTGADIFLVCSIGFAILSISFIATHEKGYENGIIDGYKNYCSSKDMIYVGTDNNHACIKGDIVEHLNWVKKEK